MKRLTAVIESSIFNNAILLLIVINTVLIGLSTSESIMSNHGIIIERINEIMIWIFVVELILKIIVYRKNFVKDTFNVLDAIIVLVSLLSAFQQFTLIRSVRLFRFARTFRSLRSLRAVSSSRIFIRMKPLRIIIKSMVDVFPSIIWVSLLLLLIYYIYGVFGVMIYGESFPEFFGHLGFSMFTLFQVMTCESWSSLIARPMMKSFPWSPLYFVSFIIVTTFVMLNVIVGLVVNAVSVASCEFDNCKEENSV